MTRLKDLKHWLANESLAKSYGIKVEELEEGCCHLTMTATDEMTVSVGIVQGGVTSILADFAAVTAAMSVHSEGHTPCQNINITFFRPIKAGEKVDAIANVINISRSITVTFVTVIGQDDKPKAMATITFSNPRSSK